MKPFQPTPAQIRAAEAVLVAKTIHLTVEADVAAYEAKALETLELHAMPSMSIRLGMGADTRIREGRQAHLLGPDDLLRWDAERKRAMGAAGYEPTEPYDCPAIESATVLMQAEQLLISELAGALNMNPATARNMSFTRRKQFVDLALKLLVPFVEQQGAFMRRLAS